MRRFLIIVIALALSGASGSDSRELLADQFSSLLSGDEFQLITTVEGLVSPVADALDVHGTFSMANPGESWNPSCIRDSANPEPDRILIIAMASPKLVAVHFERGGYSRHSVLELFQLDARGDVEIRCMYTTSLVARSPAKLRAAFPDAFDFLRCTRSTDAEAAARQRGSGSLLAFDLVP